MITPDGGQVAAKQRVLVVDDHPIFRHGLVQLLNNDENLEVCAEANSSSKALAAVNDSQPDVAVLDVSMEGMNGIELVKHLRAQWPKLPVVMLSMHDENLFALRALRAGANAYVMKREAVDVLLDAVRNALAGKLYVSPKLREQLIFRVVNEIEGGDSPLDNITPREREVLQLIGEGVSSRHIAERLGVSIKTVETHRLHIKEKLCLGSAGELSKFAAEWVAQQSMV